MLFETPTLFFSLFSMIHRGYMADTPNSISQEKMGKKKIMPQQESPHHNPKALPGFFLRIFSSITCLKKPVFSKEDLLPSGTNLKSQNSTSPKGVSLNHDPMTRCSIMSAYSSHPLCTAHFVM
jgi:hypothetical protein